MAEEQAGLELNGFGLGAKVIGKLSDVKVMLLVLIFASQVGLSVFMYAHAQAQDKLEKTLAERVKSVEAKQAEQIQEQQSTNYILLLTSEERKRLKIDMPASLRRKLQSREIP